MLIYDIRMVFQQPLVPILPVARELISKTKWIASKASNINAHPQKSLLPATNVDSPLQPSTSKRARTQSPHHRRRKGSPQPGTPPDNLPMPVLSGEIEQNDESDLADVEDDTLRPSRPRSRRRILSLFSRTSSRSKKREASISTKI
jgi:hypothetical protein